MITPNFHLPFGINNERSSCFHRHLGYLYVARRSYTPNFLRIHDERNCWHFQGVHKLPHSCLTWIQLWVLTKASIASATHPLHLLAITDSAITLDLKSSTSPFYISLYSLSDTKEVSLFCSSCLSGNTSALVVNHSALSSYLQFFQRAFSKPLALPKKHHVEVGLLFLITNLTIG